VKGLTVDSSVIISSLLEQESRHQEALEIWQRVLAGKVFAVMPYSVLVEVVAAIRRRTGSEDLALEVKKALLDADAVSFIVLDEQAAEDAAEIAAKTAVRGMDALVIQVAREFGTELISFDHEMMAKAAKVLLKAAP
jgi:predicted nucleic acid-binding protein